MFFERTDRPDTAAVIYGVCSRNAAIARRANLPETVTRVRATLGSIAYEQRVAEGERVASVEAIDYARHQIERARRQLSG